MRTRERYPHGGHGLPLSRILGLLDRSPVGNVPVCGKSIWGTNARSFVRRIRQTRSRGDGDARGATRGLGLGVDVGVLGLGRVVVSRVDRRRVAVAVVADRGDSARAARRGVERARTRARGRARRCGGDDDDDDDGGSTARVSRVVVRDRRGGGEGGVGTVVARARDATARGARRAGTRKRWTDVSGGVRAVLGV